MGIALALLVLALPGAAAAKTFTVNGIGDQPDAAPANGTCDVDAVTDGRQCTLRAAIVEANSVAGIDDIEFDIPGDGTRKIRVQSSLPAITQPVHIDGYTQPGSARNTATRGTNAVIRVQVDGREAPENANGLNLRGATRAFPGFRSPGSRPARAAARRSPSAAPRGRTATS